MWSTLVRTTNPDQRSRGRHERLSEEEDGEVFPSVLAEQEQVQLQQGDTFHDGTDTTTTTSPTSSSSSSFSRSTSNNSNYASNNIENLPDENTVLNHHTNIASHNNQEDVPVRVSTNDTTSTVLNTRTGIITTEETRGTNTNTAEPQQRDHDNDDDVNDGDDGQGEESHSSTIPLDSETHNTLLQIAEERELHRRRTSAFTLFVGFVLLRIWIEAIVASDIGLLFMCALGSSYMFRWVKMRQSQEQEFDERIEHTVRNSIGMNERNGHGNDEELGQGSDSGITRRHSRRREASESRRIRAAAAAASGIPEFTGHGHIDLEMLSFQAQLAFAIMDSQRITMNGGYGRPDGDQDENRTRGVSADAKSQWDTFVYSQDTAYRVESSPENNTNQSLMKKDMNNGYEEPACCICLCEYEDGEKLMELPCGHSYHSECISSWCDNHVRCPLCNHDLEDSNGTGSTRENDHNNSDSIV